MDVKQRRPLPTPVDGGDESDDETYAHAAEAAWQERKETAEHLRLSWAEGDIDPLLSTLTSLRNQRLQLEADTRLLIAYGRCFTHPPRPTALVSARWRRDRCTSDGIRLRIYRCPAARDGT